MSAAGMARRAAWTLGLAIAVVAVAVAALYGFVQTDAGRAWVADRVAAAAGDALAMDVGIDRVAVPAPGRVVLGGLRLGDDLGQWATVREIAVDWRPLALLAGRLDITRLAVVGPALVRLPERGGGAPAAAPALPRLSLPVDLVVRDVAVVDGRVEAPAPTGAVPFEAAGTAELERAGRAVLRLDLRGGDGGAAVQIEADPQSGRLALSIEAEEAAGGAIAALIGRPDLAPWSLHLAGEGTLEGWQGRLSLRARDDLAVDAAVTLAARPQPRVRLEGTAQAASLVPPELAPLVAGPTAFDVELALAAGERLELRRGRVESRALALEASGSLRQGTLEASLGVEARPAGLALLADRLAPLTLEGLSLTAELAGPWLEPVARVRGRARAPAWEGTRAEELVLEIELRPDRPWTRPDVTVAFEGHGGARRAATDMAVLRPLLGERLEAGVSGTADLGRASVGLRRFALRTEGAALDGSAGLDLATGEAEVASVLSVDETADSAATLGLALGGALALQSHLRVFADGRLEAILAGTLARPRFDEPVLSGLAGDELVFFARAAEAADGAWRIDDASLDGAAFAATGTARFDRAFTTVEAPFRLALPDLSRLAEAAGTALAGRAEVEGSLAGPLSEPQLVATARLHEAMVAGRRLGAVTASVEARGLGAEPAGRARARLDELTPPLEVATAFAVSAAGALRLDGLEAAMGRAGVAGALDIDAATGLVAGTLSGRLPELAQQAALAGLELDGSVDLAAELGAADGRQRLRLTAEGRALSWRAADGREATAGRVELAATVDDLWGTPGGDLAVEGERLAGWSAAADGFRLTARGSADAFAVELTARGTQPRAYDLALAGDITRDAAATQLTLSRLELSAAGSDARLRAPARLEVGASRLALRGLELAVGEGRVAFDGALGADELEAAATVSDLPLALLGGFVPGLGVSGALGAELELSGTRAAPAGTLTLAVQDLGFEALADVAPGPLAVRLEGRWDGRELALEGGVSGFAAGALELAGTLPLLLPPDALVPTVPGDRPLSGRLAWQGEIRPLWELTPFDLHQLAGAAQVDLGLAGTRDAPALSGRLALQGGTYESLRTGTLIEDLSVDLKAAGERLDATLSGSDGGTGRYRGRGVVELRGGAEPAYRFDLGFEQATIVRRDELTAVADGALKLEGDLAGASLAGTIDVTSVEARIPDQLPPTVVELEVVERGAAPGREPAAGEPAAPRRPLTLELDVTVAPTSFLRGRGLESSWQGALQVTGTADAPRVQGQLRPVRGSFSLVGKTFDLREGSIRFDGGPDIDPLLDLSARHEAGDIVAIVAVGGRASAPEIDIRSEPELPQGEVLSRVLFGKGTRLLGATEALQLAATTASLSGAAGGGTDIFGFARRTLGVDVVRLEETAEGSPAVGVGKYVGESVYVGVQQGTRGSRASVEVEIAPNLSVEGGATQAGASDVGIKWKWDY